MWLARLVRFKNASSYLFSSVVGFNVIDVCAGAKLLLGPMQAMHKVC